MLIKDKSKRISVNEILNHPWINKCSFSKKENPLETSYFRSKPNGKRNRQISNLSFSISKTINNHNKHIKKSSSHLITPSSVSNLKDHNKNMSEFTLNIPMTSEKKEKKNGSPIRIEFKKMRKKRSSSSIEEVSILDKVLCQVNKNKYKKKPPLCSNTSQLGKLRVSNRVDSYKSCKISNQIRDNSNNSNNSKIISKRYSLMEEYIISDDNENNIESKIFANNSNKESRYQTNKSNENNFGNNIFNLEQEKEPIEEESKDYTIGSSVINLSMNKECMKNKNIGNFKINLDFLSKNKENIKDNHVDHVANEKNRQSQSKPIHEIRTNIKTKKSIKIQTENLSKEYKSDSIYKHAFTGKANTSKKDIFYNFNSIIQDDNNESVALDILENARNDEHNKILKINKTEKTFVDSLITFLNPFKCGKREDI